MAELYRELFLKSACLGAAARYHNLASAQESRTQLPTLPGLIQSVFRKRKANAIGAKLTEADRKVHSGDLASLMHDGLSSCPANADFPWKSPSGSLDI